MTTAYGRNGQLSTATRAGFGGTPGEAASGRDARPRLTLRKWRAFQKNTLRGFAEVRLPNGLVVRDVAVHLKDGKAWASMPAKPILEDGRHKLGEDGKYAYALLLEWETRELSEGFSRAVVAALDANEAGWRG